MPPNLCFHDSFNYLSIIGFSVLTIVEATCWRAFNWSTIGNQFFRCDLISKLYSQMLLPVRSHISNYFTLWVQVEIILNLYLKDYFSCLSCL